MCPWRRRRERAQRAQKGPHGFHCFHRSATHVHPGPKVLNLGRPCDDARVVDALRAPRPQRFVGVNYISDDERRRHYIDSRLPEQYDCLVYVDETSALEPLDHLGEWDSRRS